MSTLRCANVILSLQLIKKSTAHSILRTLLALESHGNMAKQICTRGYRILKAEKNERSPRSNYRTKGCR